MDDEVGEGAAEVPLEAVLPGEPQGIETHLVSRRGRHLISGGKLSLVFSVLPIKENLRRRNFAHKT